MPTDQELIEALRFTRADYSDECEWMRFLSDSYTGTGGYAGRIKPPIYGFLGSAAEIYGSRLVLASQSSKADTYLDRFPREEDTKFAQRQNVAHLDNYLAPIFDLFLSYANSAESTYDNVPPTVTEWQKDVTGTGVSWDQLLHEIVRPRGALLGWCPVLFDRDSAPEGTVAVTKADEQQLGLRLRAVALFPSNVLDWEVDEKTGALVAVKIRTCHKLRTDILMGAEEYEEYRVFTPTTFSVYRVRKTSGAETVDRVTENAPHSFGAVPLVSFRNKPTPGDSMRGVSMVSEIATAQRRLFNLHSELDEHIRASVFAILGVPMKDTTAETGSIIGGSGTVIRVPMDSRLPLHFVAPPESVAGTLETRIGNTVREIYRVMNAPYENDKGGAQSGTALAQKFDGTNRKVAGAVRSFALSEQTSLRLVAKADGSKGSADTLTVAPQRDFRVDDVATDIANAVAAAGLPGMPAIAKTKILERVLEKMLPNLTDETKAAIKAALAAEAAKLASAAEAAEQKPATQRGGDTPDDDEEDDQAPADKAA